MPIQYIYPDTVENSWRCDTTYGSVLDTSGNVLGVNDGVSYVNGGVDISDTVYINYYFGSGYADSSSYFEYSGSLDVLPHNIKHRFVLESSGSTNVEFPNDLYSPTLVYYEVVPYPPYYIASDPIFCCSGNIKVDNTVVYSFTHNTVPDSIEPYYTFSSGKQLIEFEYYNAQLSGINLIPPGYFGNSGLLYQTPFRYTQQFNSTTQVESIKVYNSEIVVSGSYAPQTKNINFFLQNYDAEPTGIPLVTFGKASDSGSIDFYINANHTAYMNMLLTGKSSVPSGQSYIDFFLDAEVPLDAFGFQDFYLMNNSGGDGQINFNMYGRSPLGQEEESSSIHFHTYCISGESSGQVDFSTVGGTGTHIPLYINCQTVSDSGNIPFHISSFSNSGIYGLYTMNIEGSNLKDSELNLYVGNYANEETTSYINLLMDGAYPSYAHNIDFTLKNNSSGFSGIVPLHIIGGPTDTSGTLSMYIERVYETTSDFFPMYINNSGYTQNLDLYLAGANKTSTNLDFNVLGIGESSGQVHLYINGY